MFNKILRYLGFYDDVDRKYHEFVQGSEIRTQQREFEVKVFSKHAQELFNNQ